MKPLHNKGDHENLTLYAGVLTLLKFPYPRDIEEPDSYETVRVHAEWGSRPTQDPEPNAVPVSVSHFN